jgi:septum formation protein
MMMKKRILLASNSPRRRELLSGLGVDYQVRLLLDIDESFPPHLSAEEIPQHISRNKADAYAVEEDELLITADTIVYCKGEVLGKPVDEADACRMLRQLSGCTHQVVTGVTLKTQEQVRTFSCTTQVTFAELSDEEIAYYVQHYAPYDKAGAYGVQEWIGFVGVTRLEGSYFNVMGLPVQRLYTELKKMNAI